MRGCPGRGIGRRQLVSSEKPLFKYTSWTMGPRLGRTALVAVAVVGGVTGAVGRVVTAPVAGVAVVGAEHLVEEAAELRIGNGQQREEGDEVSHFWRRRVLLGILLDMEGSSSSNHEWRWSVNDELACSGMLSIRSRGLQG